MALQSLAVLLSFATHHSLIIHFNHRTSHQVIEGFVL
jgi:hypothetical protein